MPRGDKSAYTDKQKRQAEHIEEKKENIKKMNLEELKEKADIRNKIINLEKKVEKLSDFIIDEGLAEKFNKSIEKENQRNKNMGMDFSR